MNNKVYVFLIALFLLAGCQAVNDDINKFQNGLNKLQGGLGVHSNIKEMYGIRFEAKSCELTEFRTVLCRMVVTSKYQDRTLDLLGGGYTKVQDDTGKSYPTRISFGENAEGGQRQSVLIADTPYNVTLAAENISSQATKVRAIDIARMDVLGAGQVKLVLSGPPIASVSESAPRQISTIASKDDSSRVSESGARKSTKEFRGVVFEVSSCELTELRIVLCRMVVTSKYQDRTLDLFGGGYTKVQDDTGKSYPTRMSFGENAEGGQRQSVLIAGTPYNVTLTAENISSRATKVRAIDIARMDLAGVGQVKLVLAHPPMIATQHAAGSRPAATNTVSTRPQPIAPQVRAKTAAPAVTASPATPKPPGSTIAAWQTVGLWNYDAADGQHLAQGLVLRNERGSGLGQTWKAHLELKDHNSLTPRQRTLWPVMMNVKLKKICADYPGYPTYPVFIDMPGGVDDGIYIVSYCKGGV